MRSKHSVNQDRKRLSKESWEQDYLPNRKGGYYKDGGEISAEDKETLDKLKKNLSNPAIAENIKPIMKRRIAEIEAKYKTDISKVEKPIKKEVAKVESKFKVGLNAKYPKATDVGEIISVKPSSIPNEVDVTVKYSDGKTITDGSSSLVLTKKAITNVEKEVKKEVAKKPVKRKPSKNESVMQWASRTRKEGEGWKEAQARAKKEMADEKAKPKPTTKKKTIVRKKAAATKPKSKKKTIVRKKKATITDVGQTERGLKADAKRQALPAGRRISKDGNVYYEKRSNRADKSQPTKRTVTSKRRKLAEGGEMGDYSIGDIVVLKEIKMPNGDIQFEKSEGVIEYKKDGIYGVRNNKTNKIHQVLKNQIQ